MRKIILLSAVVVCVVVAAGSVALANGSTDTPGFAVQPLAGEKPLNLEEVPNWVLHTASVTLPSAEFTAAQLDQDEIGAVFEIKGTDKGAPAEVDVFPDGSLEEIELVIKTEDVPEAPLQLFNTYFPGFTLTKIEKSIRPTRTGLLEVWYEWDGKMKDGVAVDVEINSRGSTYLVEPD
jgi:hypothetical protein